MQDQAVVTSDWTLDNIPLERVDVARVREREDLFYLVTSASFIEIAADLYAHNLASYFAGDEEVVAWLQSHWEKDEVRHGRALRDYVRHVWPEFDWERAYAEFFADYSRSCTVDEFEPTQGLEMIARCVVETGTATYYQSLAAQTDEPILAGIATRIRADEINHYKHFFRYFRKYNVREGKGRLRVLLALVRRLLEVRSGDAECALWHALNVRQPGLQRGGREFRELGARVGRQVRRHYPAEMAIKMLLKPLALPPRMARTIEPPLSKLTTSWLLH